jgi:hypothetical protein
LEARLDAGAVAGFSTWDVEKCEDALEEREWAER